MLDIKFIRDNKDLVAEGLSSKKSKVDLNELLLQDDMRRTKIKEVEGLKSVLNKVNKEIGELKRKNEPNEQKINEMRDVSARIKKIDSEVALIEETINKILLTIPNVPHSSVPRGDESKNQEIRVVGERPKFNFKPKPHWEIAEKLNIVDFKRGTKITGSGFLLFKNQGARLERALINYFLDIHTKKNGFEEVSPPFLVNRNSMTGTGQLPKMECDMYCVKEDDLFLIPTAEVPVTNIFNDEIFEAEELPKKCVAYSPCFRREAGSYGKETRGMVRIHQFDKVEMVAWVKKEESYEYLEILTSYAEGILKELKLPYRVICLASGDMSFASAKTYDLEVYAAGMEKYLEVSSVSNFEDFQARRAKIRYRPQKGAKTEFLHTLNGSGLALPRIFISILENYQNEDGSVNVPEVLLPYMNGQTVIR